MQQTKTTIHLTLPDPRRLWHLPTPVAAAVTTFALIAIAALVGRIQQAPAAPIAHPTTTGPVIVIQREPAIAQPTAALPTPDQQVYQERDALRARVAELEAQQAVQPEVIEQPAPAAVYQPVYVPASAPEYAVPTPVEQEYQGASAPAGCTSERECNLQNRLANEHQPEVQPVVVNPAHFYEQTPTQQELQAESWRQEHCIADVCH